MRISIALATYNGESFLGQQLASYVAQTRLPDELVVCDDGSWDGTVSMVREFAETAPFPVRLLINEVNIGHVASFSTALANSSGDVIFLSDQDDVWLPNKLETIVRIMSMNPQVHMVIHDIAFCKSDLAPIGQTKLQRMRPTFDVQTQYVVGMATAIRREFLQYCLPVPTMQSVSHDYWLHQCANLLGLKLVVEDVLALHRRHDGSVTAGGLLNVDYVTDDAHFLRNRGSLITRLRRERVAIDQECSRHGALLDWLRAGRGLLIESAFVSTGRVDKIIAMEQEKVAALELRRKCGCGLRGDCWGAVWRLWRTGGYDCFNGWKSLISDLLFRCLLRF